MKEGRNMEQKGVLALIGIVISFIANSISIFMIILLVLMISDYVLGITAAIKQEKKFDKNKALWGIVKKIGYGIVILFAILADLMIIQGIHAIGLEMPYKAIFAIASTIYFCGLEFFSGCSHLSTIGVPVPKFLLKFANFLSTHAENVMEPTKSGE